MEVDTSETAGKANASDALVEHTDAADGPSASADSTAEVLDSQSRIHIIQDLPQSSRHSKSYVVHRRVLRRIGSTFFSRRAKYDKLLRRSSRAGWNPQKLETLFEVPFVTEDNVVIFTKPQKLRKSVDEVDQLMRNLDLRIDKAT